MRAPVRAVMWQGLNTLCEPNRAGSQNPSKRIEIYSSYCV